GLQPKRRHRTALPPFTHHADSMRRSVSMPISPAQRQRVEIASPFLTAPECGRLVELEAVIGRGLKSFAEVGLALKEIRDSRLYRGQHKTFEGYGRRRWGMGRRYANRTIEAAGIVKDLGPNGPTNEAQARELVPLSPEQRRLVWAEATTDGQPPTAKRVRKV